jgi:hypothetical protein
MARRRLLGIEEEDILGEDVEEAEED